ncbi:MAG: electron transport complex subunit E [Colwellia sp.]|nr:electron transport complex subunit E [Colwellia sp.]
MKFTDEYKELAWQGLWKNNPGLVQLLGLCPLLAVTSTLTNAIGLGLATLFVLICSNATVSAIRQWVPKEIRIPIFVLIIASFVTCVQLLMNAYTFGLYQSLGIFLPLIVTNCAIIGRAEAYASKNPVKQASFDGLMMGLGFLLVLMLLGAVREVLGQGTLFDGANLLLGDWANVLRIEVYQLDTQFLLVILPPGAFIVMGFFIAIKNVIDERIAQAKPKIVNQEISRVRVNFDEK